MTVSNRCIWYLPSTSEIPYRFFPDFCKWQEIPYTREKIRRIAQQRLEGYCKNLEKNAIQIQEKSVIIKASVTEISVEGTLEALVKASRRTETEKIKKQEGTGTYGIDTTNVGHSD